MTEPTRRAHCSSSRPREAQGPASVGARRAYLVATRRLGYLKSPLSRAERAPVALGSEDQRRVPHQGLGAARRALPLCPTQRACVDTPSVHSDVVQGERRPLAVDALAITREQRSE